MKVNLYAQYRPSNDSIKIIRMWDYRPKGPFDSKLDDLGPGYLHNNTAYKLTLQAHSFDRLMKTCAPDGKAFNANLYRYISKKNITLTVSSFMLYAASAIVLVNSADDATQIVSLLTGTIGLTGLFTGSVKLIRKTNRQRQLFRQGVDYYNYNCAGKTIEYGQ